MFAKAILISSLAATALAQLLINTPASLVECQPALITYSGGTAPYFISVLPGGETGATPLEQFPEQQSAGSYSWTVDIPAGTSITLSIRDGTGALNYADQVTIIAGTSTSCINAQASSQAVTASVSSATLATPTRATAAIAAPTPSGLYVFSNSAISALPASASYSQLGSAVGSGVPRSYQVVESGTGASGAYSATGTLIAGPSNFIYSLRASGAASALDEYVSCSASGSSAVCDASRAGESRTTFTAPYATAARMARRVVRLD